MESFQSTKRANGLNISFLIFILINSTFFFSVIPYGSQDVWYEAFFCSLILFAGVMVVLLGGRPGFETRKRNIFVPLLLLAAYSVLQGFSGLIFPELRNGGIAFPFAYDSYHSFWLAIKIFSVVVYLFTLTAFFGRNTKTLVWAVAFAGNFFSVVGLLRYFIQVSMPDLVPYFLFPTLKPGVGFGTFVNQNHFAFLMLLTLGLNICLFGSRNLSKHIRLIFLSGCLVSWTALVLTGSRAGIIGSFIVVAVAIGRIAREYSFGKNKWASLGVKFAVFCLFAAILAFGVVFVGQERVLHRFRQLPAQFEEPLVRPGFRRMELYPATVEMFGRHPIFGVGFGSYQFAIPEYIDVSGIEVPKQAHNDYLEFVASGGIVAVALGLWFLYGIYAAANFRKRDHQTGFHAAARSGAICGLAGCAFHSFFDFGLQIFSNLMITTAVLYLIFDNEKDPGLLSNQNTVRQMKSSVSTAFLILCVLSAVCSIVFGYARYTQYGSISASDKSNGSALMLPFDAESYLAASYEHRNKGDMIGAIAMLKRAIEFRPRDYRLWLEIGKLQKSELLYQNALSSFQKSTELAPHFSEPKYDLGLLLYKLDRKPEAFAALRFAYQRNPRYFDTAVKLAWKDSNGNTSALIKRLSPLSTAETVMLGLFLYDRGLFPALVELTCDNPSANDSLRNSFVIRLIEKRQYRLAYRVENKQCEPKPPNVQFIDGDFSKEEIHEGIGFGWRSGDLPSTIELTLAKNGNTRIKPALQVKFSGNSNPETPIISQLIPVEPNSEYEVSFSYYTSDLVTTGLPVMRFITRGPKNDGIWVDVEMQSLKTNGIESTVTIRTNEEAEALDVRMERKPCKQLICPVYGSASVGKFRINKTK